MEGQTVCPSVAEMETHFPRSEHTNKCHSVFIQCRVGSHSAVFEYNASRGAFRFPGKVCESLLQQVDEVMIESSCFVQTPLTHSELTWWGDCWLAGTQDGYL